MSECAIMCEMVWVLDFFLIVCVLVTVLMSLTLDDWADIHFC